jgi:hypothetical protein
MNRAAQAADLPERLSVRRGIGHNRAIACVMRQ